MYYMTVTPKGVKLTNDKTVIGVYANIKDWKKNRPSYEFSVCFSSSIDWPEDTTSNPDIIDLADKLRGNNVGGNNPKFEVI